MTVFDADPWPAGAWKRQLADAVTDRDELLRMLGLDDRSPSATPAAAFRFPLRVPRGFIARMRPGDSTDPLLRQVLPMAAEDEIVAGFSTDPVGELGLTLQESVLHKYHGRALVLATGACAVHCRYCFRRHFPYGEQTATVGAPEAVVARVAADREIAEVILSGGDPLTMPDPWLEGLARSLAALPSVRRLRVHTRMPIVLPARVDEALTAWIADLKVPLAVVVHANHANEIDGDVRRALAALIASGATLLNQTVLLAGVNDSVESLADLSEDLFAAGVLPYYLHALDPVAGAAHFRVADENARELMHGLAARLPGYLVPRLVREVAGAPAKIGVDLWA